jgi:ribosomal-protein-alanine N-acetyltransferase
MGRPERRPFRSGMGTEVSYFIQPSCQGRGFATELVKTSLAHSFEGLALRQIEAFAMPANEGSIRVLA